MLCLRVKRDNIVSLGSPLTRWNDGSGSAKMQLATVTSLYVLQCNLLNLMSYQTHFELNQLTDR